MISVVISFILIIAVMQVMLSSLRSSRSSTDVSRMQESGRIALEILGRSVRLAGARNNPDVSFSGTPLAGVDGARGAPDSLTVQYEAASGGENDCKGNPVTAGSLVTSAFSIDVAANPPTLKCNGEVVVDNIENIQIDYGIDIQPDGVIDRYTSAPTDFSTVSAVRIELLVRGPSSNVAAQNTQTLTFNGEPITRTDGYLRQVFSATFSVRNRVK
jgi:type IV pilus assembly protein PilW